MEPLCHCCSMDPGDMLCKFILVFFCVGCVYDDTDRSLTGNGDHLTNLPMGLKHNMLLPDGICIIVTGSDRHTEK